MEIPIEEMEMEKFIVDENIRQKYRKNEDLLKIALMNVNLAKCLNLKEGLIYECKDSYYFNIRTPNNEKVFNKGCRYGLPEVKSVIASQYVFLTNNWIEVPVNMEIIIDQMYKYPKISTENLRPGSIRNSLTSRNYSNKIFEYDRIRNALKPRYLPIDIEL